MDKIIIKSRIKSVYKLSVATLAKRQKRELILPQKHGKKQAKVLKTNFARTPKKQSKI